MTIETTTLEIFGADLSTTEEWNNVLRTKRVLKKTNTTNQIDEIITALNAYCINRTIDKRVFSNMIFRNRTRSVAKCRYQFATFAQVIYEYYRGKVPDYPAYACTARNWYSELRKRVGMLVKDEDSDDVHQQVCKLVNYYDIVEN